MFAFSRIRKARLGKGKYVIPANFDPHVYFDKEMGVWASSRTPYMAELLFEKEIGAYALDRKWHSTQTESRDDGACM
jgi:hypothetical protein